MCLNHTHQEPGKKLYQCPECGLHYQEKHKAEAGEAWCKEHHSCNIEITKHAVESDLVRSNDPSATGAKAIRAGQQGSASNGASAHSCCAEGVESLLKEHKH